MSFETLKVATSGPICRIAFDRPDAGNAINAVLVAEFTAVLRSLAAENGPDGVPVTVIVLEGGRDVFCAGGDFEVVAAEGDAGDPEPLYALWQALAEGPFVTIALVRGRANAGGVGFVAACDIVIAEPSARFGLSELLFGLFPACVLPFLIRRIGHQRAHFMTLMTRQIGASDALASGLVDILCDDAEIELVRNLARLTNLGKPAIARYKTYMATCRGDPGADKAAALAANRQVFADPDVVAGIRRYVTEMKFPWEE
ncbi:enoyl-CoA hydratase/isomerase [Aureimonas glaciei]|uniref:Polyketide biosynthesis enoyl-CoA hydratase PksH n=1 Tax=Aureimonas glaciei TaxID=1776957 RepID=A0A917DAP6_9HYPH|nr:enoyl-CoA hydratase/isomerase [Aureimonas glaciei]GGD19259.1 putative polyketide biosynthesis enoyl-CoA hydratase PksH [Aureimonas glaciei]